jgi:very-short-patch-repair endonuclease
MLETKRKVRYLRKTETKAEKILWKELRNKKLGIKFRRQYPIGNYILDFYAPYIKLGIELDGKQHLENKEYDLERSKYLKLKNIEILRFWNSEIESNLEKVLDSINKDLTPTLIN